MRFAPALLVAMTSVAALVHPAGAALSVCNKSERHVKVALGRFNGRDWSSEGWWSVAPKSCSKLIAGPLDARYYYLYATDGAAGTWDGGKSFCTAPAGTFTVVGRGECASRGYDRRGFFEVDTGEKPDWTQSLSD